MSQCETEVYDAVSSTVPGLVVHRDHGLGYIVGNFPIKVGNLRLTSF